MSVTDDSFFTENIVNINKRIYIILFWTLIVPVSFVALTQVGVWYVPTPYAAMIFIYSLAMAFICMVLNKTGNKNMQSVTMYLGLIGISGFVFLLGMKGVIVLTISWAFAPFISCLYYNRRLTRITTIINFVLTILAYWLRSSAVTLVLSGVKTASRWFIENVSGVIVEFIFVFLVTDFLSKRTYQTFRRLMSINADKDGAYKRLNEKTLEQFNTNKELQEKNEYIEKLDEELNTRNKGLSENQHKIVEFVVSSFGSFDLFGVTHNYHTGKYVQEISKKLRENGYYADELTDEKIETYMLTALLHDAGKIRIPQNIVNKFGKYTKEEYEIMKTHPMEGRKILEEMPIIDDGSFNIIAKEMALYHHERWDGSGYPYGVSGEAIPLCARILGAADVLDALISPRLYKEPMSIDEAMKFFAEEKGKSFEPCIADAVIALKNEIIIIDRDFKTFEGAKFDDELARWKKYHPELKDFGKAGK
ncbi:MAG: HD domain-containing phosphohydrolase [Treponema sp.]|nr:HD domain-containing phosphohydrolase [Treponema sp.]